VDILLEIITLNPLLPNLSLHIIELYFSEKNEEFLPFSMADLSRGYVLSNAAWIYCNGYTHSGDSSEMDFDCHCFRRLAATAGSGYRKQGAMDAQRD
jgi:hypothetical protein